VRPGQYQLGRPAVAESGNPSGLGSRDGSRRGRGDGEPGPGDIPHEGQGAPGSHGAAGHREPRSLPGLELHHQPTRYGTAELIRVNENLELVLGWPLWPTATSSAATASDGDAAGSAARSPARSY